jgi:hypothetical protein
MWADHDRLNKASGTDRLGKLKQRLLVEMPARLFGMRLEASDWKHLHPVSSDPRNRRLLRHFPQQR